VSFNYLFCNISKI